MQSKSSSGAAIVLTLLSIAVVGVPSMSAAPLGYSPDGVYLYDLNEHSAIWGRGFNYTVTAAEAATIYNRCAEVAAAHGEEVGFDDCLMPYIDEIYWTMDGRRIDNAIGDGLKVPVGDGVVLPPPGATQELRLKTNDFRIFDNVDPFSKDAEGYVIFSYYDHSGHRLSEPKKYCLDQNDSSGVCAAATNVRSYVDVTPNGCLYHRLFVEFWDEDTNIDDRMDISVAKGQATSDITFELYPSCENQFTDAWWGDKGNENSPETIRCHNIGAGSWCELIGEYDVEGDNDDAGLEFTAQVVSE